MSKYWYGIWTQFDSVVVPAFADTAGRAKKQILKKAQDAYPCARFVDIRVRRDCGFKPTFWWDGARKKITKP